jgi:hypothetical protein
MVTPDDSRDRHRPAYINRGRASQSKGRPNKKRPAAEALATGLIYSLSPQAVFQPAAAEGLFSCRLHANHHVTIHRR